VPGPQPGSSPAGFATTGALLNHGARMTYKSPPTERVLRSPREPAGRTTTATGEAAVSAPGLGEIRSAFGPGCWLCSMRKRSSRVAAGLLATPGGS
jgi:hypothetical protein